MRISYMLRGLSQLLVLSALGLLLYDLIYQWLVKARIKVRTVEEFWGDIGKASLAQAHTTLKSLFPLKMHDAFMHLPAPVAICIVALFFYIIFRFMFFLSGDSRGARL